MPEHSGDSRTPKFEGAQAGAPSNIEKDSLRIVEPKEKLCDRSPLESLNFRIDIPEPRELETLRKLRPLLDDRISQFESFSWGNPLSWIRLRSADLKLSQATEALPPIAKALWLGELQHKISPLVAFHTERAKTSDRNLADYFDRGRFSRTFNPKYHARIVADCNRLLTKADRDLAMVRSTLDDTQKRYFTRLCISISAFRLERCLDAYFSNYEYFDAALEARRKVLAANAEGSNADKKSKSSYNVARRRCESAGGSLNRAFDTTAMLIAVEREDISAQKIITATAERGRIYHEVPVNYYRPDFGSERVKRETCEQLVQTMDLPSLKRLYMVNWECRPPGRI